MKPFEFQKFSILQSKEVFRVGTDAVLIGALANVDGCKKILEVGSGTGIISLMIAQRNSGCEIRAIEINPKAAQLCFKNFQNSPFRNRLQVFQGDFKNWTLSSSYDFIVCNPPYFEENNSIKDRIARQKIALSFEDLVQKAVEHLHEEGRFCVILPSNSKTQFQSICEENHLYCIRNVDIFGIEGGKKVRVLLEFSKVEQQIVQEQFVIEKSPRMYSNQYLELTKEFHIFK